MEALIFYPMALIALVGAIGMVTARNPVHSALLLIVNFFGVAGIFLTLLAPLLAVLQIIVYAGAIMVLFLFVILFFVSPGQKHITVYSLPAQTFLASLVVIALFIVILYAFYAGGFFYPGYVGKAYVLAREEIFSPGNFGHVLFSRYLLPFELTSVLLLVAILGAVVLGRKDPREKPQELSPTQSANETALRSK